jgi:hypothetical protein
MKMEDPALVILKRKIDNLKEKIEDIDIKRSKIDTINKDTLLSSEKDVLHLEKKVKKMALDIGNKLTMRDLPEENLDRKMLIRKMYELDENGEILKENYIRLETNLELSTEKNIDMKLQIDKKI